MFTWMVFICARLRHVAGTQWDNKKNIDMKYLETPLEDVSIAGWLPSSGVCKLNLRITLDTSTEYPVKFKSKVIHRYEKGKSIKGLSQELNIAQSTLYHWRKPCNDKTFQKWEVRFWKNVRKTDFVQLSMLQVFRKIEVRWCRTAKYSIIIDKNVRATDFV